MASDEPDPRRRADDPRDRRRTRTLERAAARAAARAARRPHPGRRHRRGARRGRRGLRGRHRTGRDRRRARLGLPLLRPRLPRAAAARGRRHGAGRPDPVRRPQPPPGGARRHRVDPARRHPGPALPDRARAAPDRRSSTPSSPAGCSATRASGWPRWSRRSWARGMRKEHSAVDWSTRPLPEPWLEYAALDVEVLARAARRARRRARGDRQGRVGPRRSSSTSSPPRPQAPRQDPWRRTSGLHRARGRRALAAVRALWQTRDAIASQRDVTPGRIIPDSAIVEAANALPARPRHPARAQGLPRPRRRALRHPVGRRAARGARAPRRRPAPRRRTVRRSAAARAPGPTVTRSRRRD